MSDMVYDSQRQSSVDRSVSLRGRRWLYPVPIEEIVSYRLELEKYDKVKSRQEEIFGKTSESLKNQIKEDNLKYFSKKC